jgi:hypothetical protein
MWILVWTDHHLLCLMNISSSERKFRSENVFLFIIIYVFIYLN